MERKRYRPRRCARARLRLEALENRELLAVAAFGVNLYADVGGAPGEPITDGTVEVGESFFVEITAQEFDPRFSGLRGIALDIGWDPAALAEIDDPFSPAAVITPLLPAFQSGTLDAAAGGIDNLAGAAFLASGEGRAIGDAGPERFALLHFRALAAVDDSPITLAEGKSSIVSVPTATFAAAQLDFARPLIDVVEPVQAAAEPAVQFFQSPGGAAAEPIAGSAVDPTRSFYVEIAVTAAHSTPQTAPIAPPAADSAAGQTSSTAAGALHAAAERVVASLPLDPADGDFVVSSTRVQTSTGIVSLPLAAGPMDQLSSLSAGARSIGLTYVPCAAVDAVFETAADEELAPTEIGGVDEGWMQALASGLALAKKEDPGDPFAANSH